MRKLTTLLLAALLLLAGLPATAAPVSDLTALARYFPAETTVFAAIRTDDAYIDTIDEVVLTVDENIGGLLGGRGLRAQLDTIARDFDPDGDFASVFGWLGDTAAVGVTTDDLNLLDQNQVDQPLLIAIALSDARAAELFLDNLLLGAFNKSETNDGLRYAPQEASSSEPRILLTDDALLIRPTALDLSAPVATAGATLADSDGFAAAFTGLPGDDYNAVAYVEPLLLAPVIEEIQMEMIEDGVPMPVDLLAALPALGPQAVGFTLSDGRSLIMDIAVNVADPAALDAAGLTLNSGGVIDLAYFAGLDITPALLIQDTNIGSAFVAALDALEALGNDADARWEAGELPFDQEELRAADDAAVFIRQSLTGLTGLSLDEFFGWMTGDYVLTASFGLGPSEVPVLPDLDLYVNVTDKADASATLDGLTSMFEQLGLNLSADGDLTEFSDFSGILDGYSARYGIRDDSFTIGTRYDVTMQGDSESYASAFDLASSYFLEDTQTLAYIYTPPLTPLVRLLGENDSDLRDLARVMALLESSSITANYGDDGNGAVRLVITLAE